MRWMMPSAVVPAVDLSGELGMGAVCSGLLARRGFTSVDAARRFISPNLADLEDPFALGGMTEAINRIEAALRKEESVLIFGDYDVDGVTSTVLLTDFLRRFGLNPHHVVPKRLEEGYGLSIDSLTRALEGGKPDLLIAVDCGTSSAGEVAWLRRQGVSVLILDHHTSKESLPEDCILVNPHVHDPEGVPWKNLCSVGLVFKFCHALLKRMRESGDPLAQRTDLRDYLDLVAMGTVADLVELDGENRIFVKHGLRLLQLCQRPGICALMEVAGLRLGAELTPVDIGFRLGPRINASGRLDDASLPIQLLLGEDLQTCKESARILDAFNRERQEIEKAIAAEAEAQVAEFYQDDLGLVVFSPDWHAGVVGIVASRLTRKFNRPTLVLGSESDGEIKGSGRSIDGVNLVEMLSKCGDHLLQWGGHPMAVGIKTEPSRVDNLRNAFNEALQTAYPGGVPEPVLSIDARVSPGDLTSGLLQDLEQLAPFGQGNPEPVFALRNVALTGIGRLGKAHLRFNLERSGKLAPIQGVSWNGTTNPPPAGQPIDIAVRFNWNVWRGERSPRLTLLDWHPAGR